MNGGRKEGGKGYLNKRTSKRWSSGWASERVRDKGNKWMSCFLWFQFT